MRFLQNVIKKPLVIDKIITSRRYTVFIERFWLGIPRGEKYEKRGRREQRNGEPLDSDAFDDIRNDRAFVQVLAKEEGEILNGYFKGERRFGYIVFAVFTAVIVVMLAVQFAGWVFRPREFTLENYDDFVDIAVVPTKNFNPEDYIVRVTAKEDIVNLRITVRVKFWNLHSDDFYETVTVAAAGLREDETAETAFHISEIALDQGFEVLSAEGDLA